MPFWALSITFIASWWGAGSAISTADLAYSDGLGAFWYYGVPVLISTFLMILGAKAIRRVGYLTQGKMMGTRYSQGVAKILSVMILIFMTFSAASQMVGIGNFFGTYLGLDYELAVWSQKAKLEARKIWTGPVDIAKLNEMLPQIREAVAKVSGKEYDELRDMLAKCGIALTVLPHIGGSSLHGVTFSDSGKIVVGLADCEGDSARFRFSLFHELAHILCGHIGKDGGTTAEDEKEADGFAEKVLSGN